jgi:parvulin-like peptidyl-prolyl isomerase
MRRLVLALILFALLGPTSLFAQPGGKEEKSAPSTESQGPRPDQYESGVVAQVNREVITRGQVWSKIKARLAGVSESARQSMFDEKLVDMIRDILLDQANAKLQLRVDERFVRGQIENEKEDLGGEQIYREVLIERGQTEQEHMSDLMRQSERTFLLRTRAGLDKGLGNDLRPEYEVTPTVREVREYYLKHLKSEFSRPSEREIWFLAITRGSTARKLPDGTQEQGTNEKALELARTLRNDLLTGADFGVLAERFSPASAEEKGYFGWQEQETSSLAEEVLNWAFDSERAVGDLSEPLALGGLNVRGYIIVKVSGIREAAEVPFQEAQSAIAKKLKAARTEAALALVEAGIVEESYIWPASLKTLLSRKLRDRALMARHRQ